MTTLLTVVVPLRLVSEANAHEHWRKRHKRALEQHNAVAWALATTRAATPQPPLTVTITRIAPGRLDSDNAVGSAKFCRDAVAGWLGVNDRRDDLVVYVVRQEKGKPREYAVRIEIARRGSE